MSSDPVIPSKTYKAPEADYYEGTPDGFDVYSWSPSPVGTPLDKSKSTQVHLHGLVSFGRLFWRFKSNRSLDRLIAALIFHRLDVFDAPWEPEMEENFRVMKAAHRDAVLEEAASLFESVSPASDSERATRTPGADAMGAVLEFRDLIRARKVKR